MWHIITIIVLAIISIVISAVADDGFVRGACNAFVLFVVVSLTWGYCHLYGEFGNPISLTKYPHPPYKVFSATPIGSESTAVVLRDGDGRITPILFHGLVMFDTNGLYGVVNTGINGYNLELIH